MSDKPRDLYIWWGNDIEVFTEEEFQKHKTKDYYRPEDITHVREVLEPSPSQPQVFLIPPSLLNEGFQKGMRDKYEQGPQFEMIAVKMIMADPALRSPSQDEFDEKAAYEKAGTFPFGPQSMVGAFCSGARWQFNKMSARITELEDTLDGVVDAAHETEAELKELKARAPVVNEDAERDRLAEEFVNSTVSEIYKSADAAGIAYNDEMICLLMDDSFKAGFNARPARSVKDASAEELMENPIVKELIIYLLSAKKVLRQFGSKDAFKGDKS